MPSQHCRRGSPKCVCSHFADMWGGGSCVSIKIMPPYGVRSVPFLRKRHIFGLVSFDLEITKLF